MKTFKIYRASAGSGKTYQLALSYIAIAMRTPGDFKHTLAVTFTNKATREMKERIIYFLDLLASGKGNDLSDQLGKELNLDKNKIRQRAKYTLEDILHQYGHFNVTTIDSFFQTIIRSFSREMGLLGNYDVEMDTDKVLDALIDQTLQDVGKDYDLTEWLIAFAESRVEAGDKWDMRSDIAGLAKEIFTEKFKSFEKEMNDHVSMREMVRTLSQNLSAYKKRYENDIEKLAQKGLKIMNKAGLDPGRFKNGNRGGPSAFFKKMLRDPSEIPNKLALDGLDGCDAWITKNNKEDALLRHVLNHGLLDAFGKLCNYVEKEGMRYRGVVRVQRQIFTFGILADFIKRLEFYRKENDVMLISDTNYFLKEIINENETPFIYEKTGTYFNHFLIDEFQDTSAFQWENFKPLLRDSLAQGHHNMVVGDGKQSIYRFREGDWDLLNNRINKEINREYLTTIHLKTNYRSAFNIINFNNIAFEALPAILKNLFDLKRRDTFTGSLEHLSQSYLTLYNDVRQSCMNEGERHPPGYVKIRFIPDDFDAGDWKEEALNDLEHQIETLLDSGISPGEIAILVRRKKEGSLVINKLLSHSADRSKFHYKIISNESLFLDASWAVRLVIYGIRMINDPTDKLARVGLLYEYLKNKDEHKLADHEIFDKATVDKNFQSALPYDFLHQLPNLKLQPLLDQAESLIRIFKLDKSEEHTAFLSALQNSLTEYSEDVANITGEFLDWWEEKGRVTGVQMPEETNAIRVLTIHKSKGLEYKAVILPFCNWNLDHDSQHSPVLWCHSEDPVFNNLKRFPLKYSSSLINTIFSEDYLEEYGKTLIDNLNLLYVAFTRAEEVLIVHAKLPKKNKSGKNPGIKDVSGLLYELFDNPARAAGDREEGLSAHFDPEKKCYECGKLKDLQTDIINDTGFTAKPYASNTWSNKIRIKTKAGAGLDGTFEQRKTRINLGIIIHRVLANIKTISDTERQLFLLKQEGLLSNHDMEEVRSQMRQIFENNEVKPWFDGSYEVKTESPILTNNGHKYQPDRVMLKGKDAVVIDFKTGEPSPLHARQIKKYGELLEQMGYAVKGTYLLYTKLNKVENIV